MPEYYNHPETPITIPSDDMLNGLASNPNLNQEQFAKVHRTVAVRNVMTNLAYIKNSFIGLPKTPALDKALWNTNAMLQNSNFIMKHADRIEEESKHQGMDVGLNDHHRWLESIFSDPAVKATPEFVDTLPGMLLKDFQEHGLPQEIKRFNEAGN
jgi:hypothetical protein